MPSKLGGHFMNGGNPQPWIAAGARVFKFTPEVLGMSSLVPPGPLVVGKLDQEEGAIGLTDWKALMRGGTGPVDAARARFNAQTGIHPGGNRPPVNRYKANPRVDVWEDDNEVQPDDEIEGRWYALYCVEMMKLYESIGKRRANFSFAVGTPEFGIWEYLLPAVRYARDNGHYISLHEYMGAEADFGVGSRQVDANGKPINHWFGRDDGKYPYGWAALRYRYVWDRILRPAGLGDARLIITEAGCDSVPSVTPHGVSVGTWKEHREYWKGQGHDPETYYAGMLGWYDERLREDAFVAGATVFTVGSVGIWRNWDIGDTNVERALLDHISTGITDPPLVEEPTPIPVPPSPAPPPVPAANLLGNGSFEGGWYHPDGIPELQLPAGWDLKWRDGNDPGWPNPYDDAPHSRFVRPEVRVLPEAFLPEHERPLFIRDGRQTLKVFKGQGALYFTFMQTVSGLTPGATYRLATPVYPDVVMRYEDNRKVWADDARACQWRVRVGPVAVTVGAGPFGGGWKRLEAGKWNEPAAEFKAGGTTAEVKVDFLMPFALPQNGIFADEWTLAAVTNEPAPPVEPPPPPPQEPARWKSIIFKLPQDVTEAEVAAAVGYVTPRRRTLVFSHDDLRRLLTGGNADSYAEIAFPSRQKDVVEMVIELGYQWMVPEGFADTPPTPAAPNTADTFRSPVGTSEERAVGLLWN